MVFAPIRDDDTKATFAKQTVDHTYTPSIVILISAPETETEREKDIWQKKEDETRMREEEEEKKTAHTKQPNQALDAAVQPQWNARVHWTNKIWNMKIKAPKMEKQWKSGYNVNNRPTEMTYFALSVIH